MEKPDLSRYSLPKIDFAKIKEVEEFKEYNKKL